MKACQYFEVKVGWYGNIPDKSELTPAAKHYTWRGFRQSRGIRSKTKRVFTQFSPHDFTAFHWHGTASLLHYVTVVILLAVFLAAELNPFYLKVCVIYTLSFHDITSLTEPCVGFQSLLWMEPDHPFVIARLAGVFLCALPAVRELYQYINDPRYGATISLFSLLRFSGFDIFTRPCALQESGENGTARLAIARYDRHRVVGHCQVEQWSVSCSLADTRTDRLVSWGGTVSALSSRSGECSRKPCSLKALTNSA